MNSKQRKEVEAEVRALVSALTKAEGGKSQIKVGDCRQALRMLAHAHAVVEIRHQGLSPIKVLYRYSKAIQHDLRAARKARSK